MHAPEDTQPGTPHPDTTSQPEPLWLGPDTVAIGQAATQLREALGGPEGRAQVDRLWQQREQAARARRG